MLTKFRKKFIGDRAFFHALWVLVLPIVVQNAITSFVSLLDNVMVGALGTEAISAVAIVNQLLFVLDMALFGLDAGASIFGAQFCGQGNQEGMRQTFRVKLGFSLGTVLLGCGALALFGETLISAFLTGGSDGGDLALTLELGMDYLRVILWSLLPFAVVQAYTSTLREAGETVSPMAASCAAICVNCTFNYLLIFGKFGFPELGVTGAAIATVLSRYVELAVLVLATHLRPGKFPFMRGVYRSLYVPKTLLLKIVRTGSPLLLNEVLWSLGTVLISQSYSTRGLDVVAATNISSTAWNLFSIVLFGMSSAISIMVGQLLGAGRLEEARDTDNKLIFFDVVLHVGIGLLVVLASPFIPLLYNTGDTVRSLASAMLVIQGIALPIAALYNGLYFTVRCGGKTVITLLFDSCFTIGLVFPFVAVLCRLTALSVLAIYALERGVDLIRVAVGLVILKSGIWARNLVGEKTAGPGEE